MARPEFLREFRELDALEVASWPASLDEVRRWAGSDPGWPVDASVFGRWHAGPGVRPYVLCDAGEQVGYGEVGIDEPEREVELARIIVSPDRRRRGVGRRLVRLLLEQASPAGLPDAFVRVVPENRAALACYRGAGFSPVSESEREEFNRGQPVDYVWMHYPLCRSCRCWMMGIRSNLVCKLEKV
jgi:ribosomal protein S18 acetylase RimI-like enzyme